MCLKELAKWKRVRGNGEMKGKKSSPGAAEGGNNEKNKNLRNKEEGDKQQMKLETMKVHLTDEGRTKRWSEEEICGMERKRRREEDLIESRREVDGYKMDEVTLLHL